MNHFSAPFPYFVQLMKLHNSANPDASLLHFSVWHNILFYSLAQFSSCASRVFIGCVCSPECSCFCQVVILLVACYSMYSMLDTWHMLVYRGNDTMSL